MNNQNHDEITEKVCATLSNLDVTNENKLINYILQPHKIPDFININILKEYVKKDLDGNKEYYDDLNITYRISDPKKAEWILKKSIMNSKLVGNGNTYIDILINDTVGIDVSVLTLNKASCTNEKSIMQNFTSSGDLDMLFNDEDGEKAVKIFRDKLKEKYNVETKKLENIYYLNFICKNKNVYISCLKLFPENIVNMKYTSITKNYKNILIDNFIDAEYGNVKLYKSKKRLELRLCKNIVNHEFTQKIF